MPELNAAIVTVTPFQQNCTLLWEEPDRRALVIDPGGEVPRILEAIRKQGLAPERILLTHGHIDHAGGAAELKAALEAEADAVVPLEGPDARDLFLLEGLEAQAAQFGMTDIRNVLPDRWLAEGDEVRLGSQSFAVLHCPGHTPGHLVFVNREKRFAQVGDVLLRLDRPHRFSVWRPRGPDPRDPGKTPAARRRFLLHLRPRPGLDARRRTPHQPVPAGLTSQVICLEYNVETMVDLYGCEAQAQLESRG